MKKIIFAMLLISTSLAAQVEDVPLFSGKVFMSQTGAGAGYWEVSGTFEDQSGYYDAASIQVGDIVFFTDAGVGYHLPITVLVSATPPSFTVRINNTGIIGVAGVPTGEGVIYETSTSSLVPFVSGITDPNQQTLLQYGMEKIQAALDTKLSNILPNGTVFIGNGSNVATSRTLSGDLTTTNTGVVTVDKIDNTQVLATGASNGQTLTWSTTNSRWEPSTPSSGVTDLTISGTTSPLTLNSSTGTDITITSGTGISLMGTSGNVTINNTGVITETDGSITNEGSLTVNAGTGTTSVISSNTSGSTDVTITAGTGMSISENTGTNNITLTNASPDQTVVLTGAGINVVTGTYPSFTITGTEVDGSITNELQTITATSDATSHTETLSSTGGSIKLVEGSGITLTTTGTSADAIVTIASTASGTTDLTITGSSSPLTLNSSSGTDVTLTAGTGVTLSGTSGNATITNSAPDQTVVLTGAGITAITGTYPSFTVTSTEVDGNISNEGSLSVNAGTSTTSVIASNTSGSTNITLNAGSGLSISENTGTNNITLTNSSPDQTVSITGAGINVTTGTYPNFTVTGTEVDGNLSNEGSLTVGVGTATTSIINSNTTGSTGVTVTAGTGLAIAEVGNVITLTNSSPDQTLILNGAGITSVTGTYPNFTITSTEVDGSTTNELQTVANTSDATSHTVTLSNSGGSTQFVEGSGITLTTTGTSGAGVVTIASTGALPSLANNNIWVGNASNVATAVNPSGDADISNTGVITVDRVDNIDVQATGAIDLQLMRWDNTNSKWKPTDERTQEIELTGTSNPEISLTGNDGTSGGGNTILVTGQRGITVDNNSGVMDISLPSGTAGQFLKSNGSVWSGQAESLQSLRVNPTSGSAPYLELSNNAGSFASPSGSMQMVGVFPLDVIATGSNSIQSKISTTGAVNGDVIKYNGSSWAFAADATGSGGTNLAISGSSSPLTLTSDTGTDVTFTAGSGISLAGTSSNATITATDPSLSNEGALTVTQPFSTQILLSSNTSGSTPIVIQALSDSGIELTLGSSSFRINMIKVLREETFTATASQTAFTMSYSAPAVSGTAYPLRVFRNGVELNWVASAPTGTQYTFSGTTLTTAANVLNDVVRVNYFN